MKKILFLFLAAVAFVSCDQDDTPVDTTGSISFVVSGSGLGVGKVAGLVPERLVVSIEDLEGKTILDNKIYALTPVEHGYSTASVKLERGQYRITKYLVLSGQTAAYATPKTGAEKASLIDEPLPFEFGVGSNAQLTVTPKLVGISSNDTANSFGYSDFGFEIPDGPAKEEWMAVRVKLEMHLGGIFYPNVDAPVKIKGFDVNDAVVWEDTATYTGPETNDLKLKTGFSKYSIEFNKWGKTLTQKFVAADLWEGRVREGVVPITRVFQTDVAPKKIKSMTTYWSKIENGVVVWEPVNRVRYEYANGKIYLINNQSYRKATNRFLDDSQTEVYWNGNQVTKLENWLSGQDTPYSETNYTYDAQNNATHIQHKGLQVGITTEVDLSYQFTNRLVKASYRLSNGTGFEYETVLGHGNQKTDKSTKGSQLCSEAIFTYDKGINPLKHLGFTDYLLRNYSISNRLIEEVKYIGCSFPSLIPETYDYIYDADGYPLQSTTYFRGSSAMNKVEYVYY